MNWRRSVIGLAIALPVTALLAFGLTRDPREIPSPLPGQAAPGFALRPMAVAPGASATAQPTPETAVVRLADLRGQVVVLNFWASWCVPCRQEHAALSAVAKAYEGRGVRFFGVLYNDTPENARRWLADMGGQSYPTLLDPGARTGIDYGIYGVPETFFITRDGRVAYKQVGPATRASLVARIEALLARPETAT